MKTSLHHNCSLLNICCIKEEAIGFTLEKVERERGNQHIHYNNMPCKKMKKMVTLLKSKCTNCSKKTPPLKKEPQVKKLVNTLPTTLLSFSPQ